VTNRAAGGTRIAMWSGPRTISTALMRAWENRRDTVVVDEIRFGDNDTLGALVTNLIEADVLVTLGGASVGDYDLVQRALVGAGLELGFWRIAMRPGKPLMQGRLGAMSVLGLPGNPVSSVVCATLFLAPLLRKLQGDASAGQDLSEPAALGVDLQANDMRQDYLRATLTRDANAWVASPFAVQDSSLVKLLARAQCLVIRPPHAPAAKRGAECRILRLDALGF